MPGPWVAPALIGAARSRVEPGDFLSRSSTIAFCDGWRYSATTLRILASSYGLVEKLNASHSQGGIRHWRLNRLVEPCETRIPHQRGRFVSPRLSQCVLLGWASHRLSVAIKISSPSASVSVVWRLPHPIHQAGQILLSEGPSSQHHHELRAGARSATCGPVNLTTSAQGPSETRRQSRHPSRTRCTRSGSNMTYLPGVARPHCGRCRFASMNGERRGAEATRETH
jgi:hypothetical protein